jgi:hypothetical protein
LSVQHVAYRWCGISGRESPFLKTVPFDPVDAIAVHLGETGPLSQGVQVGREALRIRHINGIGA